MPHQGTVYGVWDGTNLLGFRTVRGDDAYCEMTDFRPYVDSDTSRCGTPEGQSLQAISDVCDLVESFHRDFEVKEPEEGECGMKEEIGNEVEAEMKMKMMGEEMRDEIKDEIKQVIKKGIGQEIMEKIREEIKKEVREEIKELMRTQMTGIVSALPESEPDQVSLKTENENLRRQVSYLLDQINDIDTLVHAEVYETVEPLRLSYKEILADALADIRQTAKMDHECVSQALETSITKAQQLKDALDKVCRHTVETDKSAKAGWTEIQGEQHGIADRHARAMAELQVVTDRLESTIQAAQNASNGSSDLILRTAETFSHQVQQMMSEVDRHVEQGMIQILEKRSEAIDAIALHSRAQQGRRTERDS